MPASECSDGAESASSVAAAVEYHAHDNSHAHKDALTHSEDIEMLMMTIPGLTQVHGLIGAGDFSKVYRCSMKGHEAVAVKTFSLGVSLRSVLFDLQSLRHPNLVQVLQINKQEPATVVMEFCSETLHQVLHCSTGPDRAGVGEASQRLRSISGVVSAVAYLHSNEIMHRSISSKNCFVAWDAGHAMTFKLGEFTMARAVASAVMTTWTGSFAYMAPEVADDSSYSYPADIYSVAILMHEAVSRKQPYGGSTNPMVMAKVIKGFRPDLTEVPSLDGDDAEDRRGKFLMLLEACWNGEPLSRPKADSAAEAMQVISGGTLFHSTQDAEDEPRREASEPRRSFWGFFAGGRGAQTN